MNGVLIGLVVAQLTCADVPAMLATVDSPEVVAFARWCEAQAEAQRQAEARVKASQPQPGPDPVLCPASGRVECHNQFDPLPPKK